jgi:hypothetical protein
MARRRKEGGEDGRGDNEWGRDVEDKESEVSERGGKRTESPTNPNPSTLK